MAAPLLLTYNLDGQQILKLRYICAQLKIMMRAVPRADYGQPLGALAGLRPRLPGGYSGAGFHDEMLVMANFNSREFHAFLDALRASGARSVALKAVLTPANAAWDSVRLRDELAREHEALHKKN